MSHRSLVCLTRLPLAIALFAAPVGSTLAHHSHAIYELDRTRTLEGTVTRYDWINPHVYLYVDIGGESGDSDVWQIEASPTALMLRRGWTRDTFVPGDHVTVEVNPGRRSSGRMALGRSIVTPDGRTLAISRDMESVTAPPATRPGTARSLAGTWYTVIDPAGGDAVPQLVFGPNGSWDLTEAGAAAFAGYDDTLNPAAECVAYTAPMTMVFPDTKLIQIGDDAVTIRSSLDDVERTIRLAPAPDGEVAPENQGTSFGRWDGPSALVVETDGFVPRLNGIGMRLPSSERKRLLERFELSEDRTSLSYSFELTDPEYLNQTVSGESRWIYQPDTEYKAERCNVENAREYLHAWEQ